MKKIKFLVVTTGLYLILAATLAHAQSYKYMDSSGNINFVDRLEDVPLQYRNQIPGFVPTPGFVMNKKEKAKLDREALKKEKQKERQKEKEKKKREKQLQREEEARKKKLSKAEMRQLRAEERQNKLEQKQGLRDRNEKEATSEGASDNTSTQGSESDQSGNDAVEAIQ